MTTFRHKTQPIEISYLEYIKLPKSEQMNFDIVNTSVSPLVENKTEDLLGIGTAVSAVVLTPVLIIKSIFD